MIYIPLPITGWDLGRGYHNQKESFITNSRCSICRDVVGYRTVDGDLYFDGNCECTSGESPLRHVGWDELAEKINKMEDIPAKAQVLEQWGIRFLLPCQCGNEKPEVFLYSNLDRYGIECKECTLLVSVKVDPECLAPIAPNLAVNMWNMWHQIGDKNLNFYSTKLSIPYKPKENTDEDKD